MDAEEGQAILTCMALDNSFQVLDLPSLLPLVAEVSLMITASTRGHWQPPQLVYHSSHSALQDMLLMACTGHGLLGAVLRLACAEGTKAAVVIRGSDVCQNIRSPQRRPPNPHDWQAVQHLDSAYSRPSNDE